MLRASISVEFIGSPFVRDKFWSNNLKPFVNVKNVQVVMEKLGGGGHQTMAATQIPDITVAEAKERLLQVLAEEFAQPEQSK